jgi:hypothetical protein
MIYILRFFLIFSSIFIVACGAYLKAQSTALTAQQQKQSILKNFACFQDPVADRVVTSASEQADFAPAVFPNYFSYMPEKEALALIDKSIASVLGRLQIPYIDPARPTKADGTPNILKDGFFITLQAMI